MFSSSLLIPALLLAQSCIAAPQCAKRNGSKSEAGSTTGSKAAATGVTTSTISSASISPRPSGVPVVGGGTGNSTRPRGLDFDVSFVLDLDNEYIDSPSITSSSGLTVDADVYIVDMERTTEEKIAEYHADGKTVICYFCAGTWEIGRVDSADFDPACFCADGEVTEDGCTSSTHKMDDWEEWWLGLHTETCKTDALARMNARMARAKEKGCDGVDPDNVDSYLTKTQKTHGNTIEDEVDYLLKLAQAAHDNGLLIDLKNSAEMIRSDQYRDLMVDAFDFSVIESCLKWNECDDYDAFLTAGKPRIQLEYGTLDSCPALKPGAHMLLYSGKTINIGDITKECSP